jgi:DNA-binding transcriptional regulator YhcF (GntR family)/DNA-binding LacI/PurR family transcriptional regulator
MSAAASTPNRKAPKHARLRERLRKRILDGDWPEGTSLPSARQLQKTHRASDHTVLRALKDLEREGLIVRRQGVGTIVTRPEAPPPIRGRALKLGILWRNDFSLEDLAGVYLGCMTRGVLSEWGIEAEEPEVLPNGWRRPTGAKWRQPSRGLTVGCLGTQHHGQVKHPPLKAVRAEKYEGLITLGIDDRAWLAQLLKLGVPTVVADFPGDERRSAFDKIFTDPLAAYGEAVRWFLDRGLTRIHFLNKLIWAPPGTEPLAPQRWRRERKRTVLLPDSQLRLNAYRQAMSDAGCQVPENWIHSVRAQDELMNEFAHGLAGLPEDQRPQVVIGHDIWMVERCIEIFIERGLNLQGAGAGIVGWNGRALLIQGDGHEMGRVAADLLIARLRRPQRPFLNVGIRMTFHPPAGRDRYEIDEHRLKNDARAPATRGAAKTEKAAVR